MYGGSWKAEVNVCMIAIHIRLPRVLGQNHSDAWGGARAVQGAVWRAMGHKAGFTEEK